MKILFICDEFPPGKTGGIGTATQLLAKSLALQGHQIFVAGLYTHGYGGADFETTVEGVQVWRLRYKTDIGLIKTHRSFMDKLAIQVLRKLGILGKDSHSRIAELFSFVTGLIEKHDIDIVEMPDWNDFFLNISPGPYHIPPFNAPLVVKMHGSHSYFRRTEHLPLKADMVAKELALYERAEALSAVSRYTADTCKEIYGLEKPIEVLYNGVELRPYKDVSARANCNEVVYSGSMMKKKGIYALINAWNTVNSIMPGATLHVYGKGNFHPIQALLTENAIKTVTFYGHVGRDILMAALEKADLAVFPSFTETFGMAAAEAMGTGCPVIFTTLTSGPELITDRVDGLLIDPRSPAQLSEIIVNTLNDRMLRVKIGKGGYEKVRKAFETSHVAEMHVNFYNGVIAQYKTKRVGT